MIEQYFNDLYKKDINCLVNILKNKFIINKTFLSLLNQFPINNNGYIEFSINTDNCLRYFFAFYQEQEQNWIDNNIYEILKSNISQDNMDVCIRLLNLFDDVDKDHFVTYGIDGSNKYMKLYFVSKKINENMKLISDILKFEPRDLENVNMMGLNIYNNKIVVKLYSIFEFPSIATIKKYYLNIDSLSDWFDKISANEVFISFLPQQDYKATIAMPTLFNEKAKKALLDWPYAKGLFYKPEYYPSWLGFDSDAKLNVVYFRPKRDYLYRTKEREACFRDKCYDDYANKGMI